MASVGINFIGVCTHLNFTQNAAATPSLMYGRRIVLVNASWATIQAHQTLLDQGVFPHYGRLGLRADNVVSIQGPAPFASWGDEFLELLLHGVELTIVNALPQPQLVGDGAFITSIFNSLTCMPQLSTWIPDIRPGLASLDSFFSLAWAHFDFAAGTLNGMTLLDGAAITDYTLTTYHDPKLLIRPFDGSPATVVTLRNPVAEEGGVVEMVISNSPMAGQDNDNDFLLHFLAGANGFPPLPLNPFPSTSCPSVAVRRLPRYRPQELDLNVACSNSGLP